MTADSPAIGSAPRFSLEPAVNALQDHLRCSSYSETFAGTLQSTHSIRVRLVPDSNADGLGMGEEPVEALIAELLPGRKGGPGSLLHSE